MLKTNLYLESHVDVCEESCYLNDFELKSVAYILQILGISWAGARRLWALKRVNSPQNNWPIQASAVVVYRSLWRNTSNDEICDKFV